jgi:hypothetical protein
VYNWSSIKLHKVTFVRIVGGGDCEKKVSLEHSESASPHKAVFWKNGIQSNSYSMEIIIS